MKSRGGKKLGVRWILNAGFAAILLLVVSLTILLDGLYRNALTEQIAAQELERLNLFDSRLHEMENTVRETGIGYLQILRKKQTMTLAETGSTILAISSTSEHAFLDSVYLREPNNIFTLVSYRLSGDTATWWLPFMRSGENMSDQESVRMIREWKPGLQQMPVLRTIGAADRSIRVLTYILPLHTLVASRFNRFMVVNVRCDWIEEQLARSTLSNAVVINEKNEVIASHKKVGDWIPNGDLLALVREQNDKAGFHILRFKGVQTVLIFRQLSKTGYVAFELVPLQAISPVMDALFHKAILFCLWACILCVLLNLLLSRLITKPVAVMSLRLSEMELQAQSYNDNLRRSYYRALAAGQMDPYKLPLPSILDQPMKNLFGSDADVTGVLWMDGQLTDTQFQQFIITFRDQFSDVFRVSQNKFLAVFSANHPDRTGAFYRLVRMVSRSGYVTDFSEVKNLNELPRCSQYLQSLLNEARFFTMSLGKVVPTVKSNQTPALSSLEKQLISALWEWNGQKALQYFNEMIALGQHEEYSRFRQFLVHLSFEITFALSAMSGTSLRQKHLLSLLESAQVIETVSNAKTAVEILELFEPFFSEISKKDVNPSHQHTITQITKRIEQDYANPQLSMVLLAEGTGLSASYLGKLFIAYKGLPISEFISQLRILEACRLLSETQESIEAIAMASGFENTKYFYSVFKKQIHCTPKEYRKHHRDGIQH